MPVNNVNAANGVYTSFTDVSQRIRAVSTSIVAIVGGAPRGRVMHPLDIRDHAQSRSILGVTDPKRHGYMSQSLNPILDQTNQAKAIRVVNGATYGGAYLTTDDPNAPDPEIALTNLDDGNNQPKGVLDPLVEFNFKPDTVAKEFILGGFYAVDPGDWNKEISIGISPSNPKGVPIRGNGHDPKKFYVDVYINHTGGLFEQPVERWLVTREDHVDEEGRQYFIEDVLNDYVTGSKYIRFKNNPYCANIEIVKEAFETFGGTTDGIQPTVDQLRAAWEIFEDVNKHDVNLLVNNGYTHHLVQHKIHQVAEQRGDALAILDMPVDYQDTSDAINYKINILNIDSSYAAIYSSNVIATDPNSGRRMSLPPSGYVASAMAYTSNNRGAWFAPAGIENGSLAIEGLTHEYGQDERDALSDAQVNAIRKLPNGLGYAIWDQQTTQRRASAGQWVQVRRLVNMVLKATSVSSQFKLFDPNDSYLRSQLRSEIEDYLEPIRKGRGLRSVDGSPGYAVICDERNNTNQDIANGDLHLDMILDPTIATKRVHVMFNINATGSRATL
jgi:phage tail sheath protein FI